MNILQEIITELNQPNGKGLTQSMIDKINGLDEDGLICVLENKTPILPTLAAQNETPCH